MVVPLLVADKFTEVVEQVSTAGAVTLSVGLVMFCVTVTLSFCVQPLVACSGYIVLTRCSLRSQDFGSAGAKPVQVIVVPLLVADKFTEVVAQVSTAGAVTLSVGLVISCVTVTLSF